jgi:hypothetical protein
MRSSFSPSVIPAGLLVLALVFVLVPTAPVALAQSSRSTTVAKPEHGFSLAVPSGWQVVNETDAAAAIARTDNRDVMAMVFVRREAKATVITDTLAKALSAMKNSTEQKLVTNSFDVFLDRPALLAEYEDATAHYRTVLVPREYEDRSQIYYGVTIGAPKAAYAKLAATFDRVLAGFQIVDLAPSPKAPAGQAPSPKASAGQPPPPKATASQPPSPKASAGQAPAPKPAQLPRGFDRAKVIERILAPQPIKPPLN